MHRTLAAIGGIAATLFAALPVSAQDTVKIGLIMPYSGQFADTATQMDNAIKLYVKQHGDTVAGKKIEFIRKDTGGIAPDVAKRLAQELIVRDNVDILAGFVLTPNALAAGRRVGGSQEIHGGDERRDLDHHDQVALHGAHLGDDAAAQANARHLGGEAAASRRSTRWSPTTARAIDAEGAFQHGFKEAGGEIVGSVRFPVANPDFSAFVQRAKDLNPGRDLHLDAGRRAAGGGRQGAGRARHRSKKIKVLGQDEITDEQRAQEHGRRRARHHHGVALRLQSQVGDEPRIRQSLQRRITSAIPISSRSAAMTACT